MLNNTDWYQHLRTICQEAFIDPQHWIVAFSGGVDSCVLLHLLHQAANLPITVVHVNHQLNPHAKEWEEHCQAFCKNRNLACVIETVHAKPLSGQSPEAAARAARYAALKKHIQAKRHCLLTAHHQDDQSETFLLQLCRGTGVKGLAAMPVIAPFAQGNIMRPLLSFSRVEIVDYAKQHQLIWIDDDSNTNLNFDRNFIRHTIIPALETRWPSISKTIARAAAHCAKSAELNQALGEMDLVSLQGKEANQLLLSGLNALSSSRSANVIRTWLHRLQFPIPSTAQLDRILADLCHARPKANPVFYFSSDPSGRQLRRYQDTIYALNHLPKPLDPNWEALWDLRTPLSLPSGLGVLSAIPALDTDDDLCLPGNTKLIIKTYNGHVRFHPRDRAHSQTLKKLCQEWQVPPWEREYLLLVWRGETPIAVYNPLSKTYEGSKFSNDLLRQIAIIIY